jgi:hypothetical protein
MNPYLEDPRYWPAFHHELVSSLYESLLAHADRYQLHIGLRQQARETPAPTPAAPEEFLEVRRRGDGRLVTLAEAVSPVNRTTDGGREAHLRARREARDAGANLVEIDLVLQGQPMLDYAREGLPHWDYAVTVTRASHPDRFEVYTATLQKRLPRFRLPLAADDRDVVVDLQAVFTRSYDRGGFAAQIDYSRDPVTPLSEGQECWLAEFLTQQGLRAPGLETARTRSQHGPSHEQIALAAYYLWQHEGCPQGRDAEHWHRAIEQLRRRMEAAGPTTTQ